MATPKDSNGITPSQKKEAEKQILEQQSKVDYDIRDFPIGFIVNNFNDQEYYVPDYQRGFVWPNSYKVRLIESLLLGLPIPLIFLSDTTSGKLEIVDGVQRISTLAAFFNDELTLEGLKNLTAVNNFKYSDLPPSQQRKLNSKSLRVIVLQTNTSEETRKELFNRLNTSALAAQDSEVRKGSYSGDFMNLITKLANDPILNQVAPLPKNRIDRQENIEFVLRFFAYSNNYQNFNHSVRTFIDEYIDSQLETFDEEKMRFEFYRTFNFALKYFPNGFRKTKTAKSTPRVRFEALSVGINLALRTDENLSPRPIEEWIDDEEFKNLTTSDGSNSKTKLIRRIEYVRDNLLNIRE